ncbi:hypothetical protein RYX36_035313 [Vicia faba]
MAKGSRGRYRIASRQYRPTPYPLARCKRDICEEMCQKKCSKALDKKECEDVTCSVCMEYPHNAVLLLCSSHDKGCRPYMCGTSLRHSNCLDQYKKAYTKVISARNGQNVLGNPFVSHDLNLTDEKNEVTELACPLCRGQVKGWTVVEPVRDYLNEKERSCMQEDCSFVGSYKELKKHVRAEHPLARPRTVDPDDEQKWRWLEWEREREDVISTVTSAMPGAVVFGDYVIEGRHNNDFDSDDEEGALEAGNGDRNGRFQMGMEAMNFFLLLHAVRQGNDLNSISRRLRPELAGLAPNRLADQSEDNELDVILDVSDDDNDDGSYNEGNDDGVSLVSRLRRQGGGRVLLNRSGRRRRRREAHATMEGS